MRLHRAFIFFLAGFLGGLIILGGFIVAMEMQKNHFAIKEALTTKNPNDFVINPFSGVFTQTLSEMTYEETPNTGDFLKISPSGRYLLFDAINEPLDTEPTIRRFYLADLMTGGRKEVFGNPTTDWLDDDVLLTTDSKQLHLFDTFSPDSPLESYDINSPVTSAKPSPDRLSILINSEDGTYLADRASGTQRKILNKDKGEILAWMTDSINALGFRIVGDATDPDRHKLSIWNTLTGEYDKLENDNFPTSTINQISWLIPDNLALIETGTNDLSKDYTFSLKTGAINYLGETSGTGETKHNKEISRLAVSSLDTNNNSFSRVIKNTSYFGDVQKKLTFNDQYIRYDLNMIDMNTAIYLRQDLISNKVNTDVVKLDLNTKKEEVLYSLEHSVSNIEVASDSEKTYWIIPNKDKLLIRSIDKVDLSN